MTFNRSEYMKKYRKTDAFKKYQRAYMQEYRKKRATNNRQLKGAIRYLERLRDKLKDQPDLLAVYEPPALHLIEVLSVDDCNRIR